MAAAMYRDLEDCQYNTLHNITTALGLDFTSSAKVGDVWSLENGVNTPSLDSGSFPASRTFDSTPVVTNFTTSKARVPNNRILLSMLLWFSGSLNYPPLFETKCLICKLGYYIPLKRQKGAQLNTVASPDNGAYV
jgi:hypothetical protein